MKPRTIVVSGCLALVLAIGSLPSAAFADEVEMEANSSTKAVRNVSDTEIVVDKADFYAETNEGYSPLSSYEALALEPKALSEEFKYFAKYESGQNYDQGFSSGDGYNALGYYQFDRRYGLQDFMVACFNYNNKTYSMFKQFTSGVDFENEAMYDSAKGELTDLGKRAEAAWHKAYAANSLEFSSLQDGWAYENYYVPAKAHLESMGILLDNRSDCVKGLFWGMCNLFGASGWRQFVGGYYNGVQHVGAGITNNMSDIQIVTKVCNYVVDSIASFYPKSSMYWQGWQNRYKEELKTCLSYLYPEDLRLDEWYITSGAVLFALENGIMKGYDDGTFGPYDSITRGQVATILYRYSNPNSTATTNASNFAPSSKFNDVGGSIYYTAAINWCQEKKVITGYEDKAGIGIYSNFGPDDPVTREQLATMLKRYADYRGSSANDYTDSKLKTLIGHENSSNWAIDGLSWATHHGIISGIDNLNGTFSLDPQGDAWRASMAKMMMTFAASF